MKRSELKATYEISDNYWAAQLMTIMMSIGAIILIFQAFFYAITMDQISAILKFVNVVQVGNVTGYSNSTAYPNYVQNFNANGAMPNVVALTGILIFLTLLSYLLIKVIWGIVIRVLGRESVFFRKTRDDVECEVCAETRKSYYSMQTHMMEDHVKAIPPIEDDQEGLNSLADLEDEDA